MKEGETLETKDINLIGVVLEPNVPIETEWLGSEYSPVDKDEFVSCMSIKTTKPVKRIGSDEEFLTIGWVTKKYLDETLPKDVVIETKHEHTYVEKKKKKRSKFLGSGSAGKRN